jgi:hypothetical protein
LRRQPGLLVVHLLTAAIVYGIPLLGGLLLIVVENAGLDVADDGLGRRACGRTRRARSAA